MARLVMVYYLGGVYVDASMGFYQSIFNIIKPESELILCIRDDVNESRITNSIIGGIEGADFVYDVMEIVTHNLVSNDFNNDVWKATGPYSINLMHSKLLKKNDITYISMLNMKSEYMDYFRNTKNTPKIVNTWTEQQKNGIFEKPYVIK